GGPLEAVGLEPVLEDPLRRPETGPRVDHRRAAHGLRDRHRDRRPALGDREAGLAVDRGDRLQLVTRIAVAVVMGTGLEDDHVEAGLGEDGRGRGAAGARADDDDVALLTLPGRGEIAERAGRLGQGAVDERAAGLDSERSLDARVDRVAERPEGLRHQRELVEEAEARFLHPPQKVFAGAALEMAEAPWEWQPLEEAQRQPNPAQHPRR